LLKCWWWRWVVGVVVVLVGTMVVSVGHLIIAKRFEIELNKIPNYMHQGIPMIKIFIYIIKVRL
jgi:hypothetical protein